MFAVTANPCAAFQASGMPSVPDMGQGQPAASVGNSPLSFCVVGIEPVPALYSLTVRASTGSRLLTQLPSHAVSLSFLEAPTSASTFVASSVVGSGVMAMPVPGPCGVERTQLEGAILIVPDPSKLSILNMLAALFDPLRSFGPRL